MRRGERFNRLFAAPALGSNHEPWVGSGTRLGQRWNDDPAGMVVKDMPGQEKMSQVILDFADPLLELCDEVEWKMSILDVAVVAWNFSLLPPEEQERTHQTLSEAFDTDEARDVFEFLRERKQEMFAANHRVIVNYSVRQAGLKLKFNVISTPELDA